MNIEKIKTKLEKLFLQHRIIFWNDADGECKDELDKCLPEEVSLLRPDIIGQLKTKVIIEIEKPVDKFLVYVQSHEPANVDDWLLDIRLYSRQFYADSSSMIIEELGLQHHQLRDYIQKRKKFFSNKQRVSALKNIISPEDMEKEIDRKMLAVLVKAEQDRFSDIIHALFKDFLFEEYSIAIPESFSAIKKMDMEESFWKFAEEMFGYKYNQPSLHHFMNSLFVSDFYFKAGDAIPVNIKQFILHERFIRDVAVCMNEWRDSIILSETYDRLSKIIAKELSIEQYLQDIKIEILKNSVTFYDIEKICASRIKDYILSHENTLENKYVIEFCRTRQNMHWANKRLKNKEIPRDVFWAVYEAIISASEFIFLKNSYIQGFACETDEQLFEMYKKTLYKFDRFYRTFNEYANVSDTEGWDILKELKIRMEDIYQHWFLDELALKWEQKANLKSWKIKGIVNHYDFFKAFPEKKAGDKNAAVYVIISDALRYEAGVEIADELNGKYRFKATCEAMLGCVPSYTELGMAALLPHKKLEITEKGDILIDNKSCSSFEQRNVILSQFKGMAIRAKDFIEMKRDDIRDMVRDKNIIYIYHDMIDASGDAAKSEHKTFSVARDTINEISKLVLMIMNNYAKYVFVTADHGFIYINRFPGDTDRNKPNYSGDQVLKMNKRFMITKSIPILENVHQANFSNSAGVSLETDLFYTIPKGMSLFYFTGGVRFFHGGMSLQEVVIPVITIEQVRGKELETTFEKIVDIQILGQNHRITTGRYRFELLQTDAVSDRIKSVTYKIGIYTRNELVSDIQIVTFDSISKEPADRKKNVVITLKNVIFSNTNNYRLVFRNVDDDIENISIPVKIDRIFTTDF